MATTSTTSTSSSSTFDRSKVINLKTSDKDIDSIIQKVFAEGGNPGDRLKLQDALSERSNNAALLSNMYKTLAETTRSIIQNLRP